MAKLTSLVALMLLGLATRHARAQIEFDKQVKFNPAKNQSELLDKVKQLTAAIDTEQADQTTYYERGKALMGLAKFDQALADFDVALQLDPKHADARFEKAMAHFMQSEFREAGDEFDLLIRGGSKVAKVHYHRGLIHMTRGKLKEAEAFATKAIELNPKYAEAFQFRGLCHMAQKRWEETIRDSSAALEHGITGGAKAHSLHQRGEALAQQSKYEPAIRDLRAAVDAGPQISGMYDSLSFYLATCPVEELRSKAEAIELGKKGVEVSGGKSADSLFVLAMCYAASDQFAEAETHARQALAICQPQQRERFREAIDCYRGGRMYNHPTYAGRPRPVRR